MSLGKWASSMHRYSHTKATSRVRVLVLVLLCCDATTAQTAQSTLDTPRPPATSQDILAFQFQAHKEQSNDVSGSRSSTVIIVTVVAGAVLVLMVAGAVYNRTYRRQLHRQKLAIADAIMQEYDDDCASGLEIDRGLYPELFQKSTQKAEFSPSRYRVSLRTGSKESVNSYMTEYMDLDPPPSALDLTSDPHVESTVPPPVTSPVSPVTWSTDDILSPEASVELDKVDYTKIDVAMTKALGDAIKAHQVDRLEIMPRERATVLSVYDSSSRRASTTRSSASSGSKVPRASRTSRSSRHSVQLAQVPEQPRQVTAAGAANTDVIATRRSGQGSISTSGSQFLSHNNITSPEIYKSLVSLAPMKEVHGILLSDELETESVAETDLTINEENCPDLFVQMDGKLIISRDSDAADRKKVPVPLSRERATAALRANASEDGSYLFRCDQDPNTSFLTYICKSTIHHVPIAYRSHQLFLGPRPFSSLNAVAEYYSEHVDTHVKCYLSQYRDVQQSEWATGDILQQAYDNNDDLICAKLLNEIENGEEGGVMLDLGDRDDVEEV